MGDWTRTARAGDSGRVLTSLTQSRNPIVRMTVSVDGVVKGVLAGDDLRPAAGMYFTVPPGIGPHTVSVDATDAGACRDATNRPMTLMVVGQ